MYNMNTVMEKHILNPDAWIDSYNDMFVGYTSNKVDHIEIAKDLVQETFLDAFIAVPSYRGDAKERTWLMSILKRKIIDYYRKCNTKKGKAFLWVNHINRNADYNWLEEKVVDASYEDQVFKLDSKELNDIIKSTINNLPKIQAEVIKLKTLGWETIEICEELGINRSNLWVILHRARKSLKFRLSNLMT